MKAIKRNKKALEIFQSMPDGDKPNVMLNTSKTFIDSTPAQVIVDEQYLSATQAINEK